MRPRRASYTNARADRDRRRESEQAHCGGPRFEPACRIQPFTAPSVNARSRGRVASDEGRSVGAAAGLRTRLEQAYRKR